LRNPLKRRPPKPSPTSMSLVEHLTELRYRIVVAGVAVAIGGVFGFMLYEPVLEILQEPYCQLREECSFLITNPVDSFSLRLKISAYIGLLVASPVVLWQVWRFVTPGLYEREKRYAIPFIISATFLFALGALLALWTIPRALEFFVQVGGGEDLVDARYALKEYLSLVVFMMLAFGIGFEFPILLVFLQMARVLTWQKLASWRRYAIVLIFIVDAVITPSGDPISLLSLALPMVLFYEVAILIGRFVLRKS
jgi:sec-independent protein translocase protein TatC